MKAKKGQYIDERSNAYFKEWLARVSAWGAVLFLMVGALDYVIFPQYFPLFLSYRVIMALVLIGVSIMVRQHRGRPRSFHNALAYLAIVGSASAIELMILRTGGHTSPYYAGMIVLAICVIGLVPAGLLMSAASTLLIYGIYVLPIIAIERITDTEAFITANAFLSAALLSMLLLRQLSQKSLRSEWGLQYDLDRQQGWLEGEVHDRTVQLLRTVEDLEQQIVERQRAEAALLQSEERYRTLAENASDMIYRMSLPDGRYEYVSPASTLLFGYAPEEFYAKPTKILQIVHPDWRGYFKEQWSRLLAGDMPPFYEYQIVHRSGEARWINQRNMLIRDEQGVPIAIEGVVSDVTERKLAEQALKESEEKFRTIFTESKDVFYISTPEGRFLDINPAGVALFGYAAKEELLAIDIGRELYVNPGERRRFAALVDRDGYAKDYHVQMKRKSGEVLSVIISSTAVRDKNNRVTAFRGIIRDVTEQKKLEQQLLQSQKMEAVGQLAGGIAHDFNNILTAIIGYAGLLRRKLPDDEPGKMFVEHIFSSAERAAALTRSLLAFSRKQIINPRPTDLNEIVNRVEKLLLRLIGEDIECRMQLSTQTLMVTADSLQLEQVLMNLATNARDAMHAGGRFTLATGYMDMGQEFVALHPGAKAGRYAWITAADTGTGIDEKILDRIFEPFFTTKEVGKGTGLGLAMAYGIVKQHDGYITVESAPGQGTTFTIYLPLLQGAAVEDRPDQQAAHAPRGTETVLVAEDDGLVRAITTATLAESGYSVLEASDGEEAIQKFKEHCGDIRLIILDVIMPRKNGKEVYAAARALRPDVKALFISGHTADIIHSRGVIEEGLHFIQKPHSIGELLNKVRAVLDA
jgi:PAS domain S-box-containing protein